jgi:hypothetical protein
MSVHLHVHIHLHTRTRTHARKHTHTHTHTPTRARACARAQCSVYSEDRPEDFTAVDEVRVQPNLRELLEECHSHRRLLHACANAFMHTRTSICGKSVTPAAELMHGPEGCSSAVHFCTRVRMSVCNKQSVGKGDSRRRCLPKLVDVHEPVIVRCADEQPLAAPIAKQSTHDLRPLSLCADMPSQSHGMTG